VVNSAHILSLYNTETKRIEDINVLDYINSPNKVVYRGIRAVAYFPKGKTFIAPYFLGLWLGDGDSRDTRITNIDEEIIDYLHEYAANLNMKISTYSYSNRTPSYSITSKEDSTRSYSNQHRVNIIRKEMEHLNLFGNKHIPEDYLCNSYENRMQLLAGLIDSDGSLDKHQVRYEISCSNNILCEQIVRLARSLGFQVTLSKRVTSCNKKDFVSNRIVIYGEIWKIPVRVTRKKAPKGNIKKNPLLYKIKVEEVGLGEYYGFTLDNKEKRFLLKDFTITHNTQIVAMITAALMIILPTLADKYPENFSIFQKGFWAGCFGPVGEQAVTMFDRIYEVFTTDSCKQLFIEELKMPIPSRGGARGNLIRLGNKSFVRYMSGSKRAKVESKTYHLIILDECQDIDSFKIRKCFAEGTEVWLPNGNIVPVEQVVKEKLDVITPDGPKTPTEWYDNGVQDVWKITTNKGKTIEVTENHRFLVRRRIGNRQAKIDILKNIKVGDAIAAPLEVPYFGNKWTYKEGLLTGLMLGDGCFTGGQPLFCGFSSVIDKLEKLLLHDCSLTKQEPKESGLISCGIRGNGTGNHVTAFFKELGLWGHKGDTKFIPAGGSKEFLRGIIEGLIETDGCVQANEISFANISEKLVRDLQNNLLRFGVHTFITSHINNGNFGNKPKRLWVLHIKDSASIIKFASNFKLITKQNKLNILAEKKKTKTPRLQAKDKRRSNDSRFVFEKINNIEYIGKKNTYCLTVETNLLVANGLMPGQSINPMGAAVNATTVATGTPDVYIGYFYDTIEQNKSFDLKNPSAKQSHFEVDYSIAQKYNAYYKKYIQKETKRLGFDSDEFKMAYRLIWPITKGMVFTKSQLEEKCYDKSLKIVTTWKETPCIAGLDLGKSQDSTVVTVIKPIWGEEDEEGNMPKVLLNWLEIEGDEWEDQYPQVIEFLSNYNIETLICDTTGVGDPIRERYTALLPSVNVGPFTFSPSSKDRGYKYLIQEINSKRLVIPAHYSVRKTNKFKKFENQMTTLKKNYSGKFLNPCPIDKDKGHDDYCLSEDTEILTARGFANINDIQYNDLVVNYNLDGTLSYSSPKKIVKDVNPEYMVSLEGPYVSQLLTNDHKILYEYFTKENGINCYKQKIGLSQDALSRIPNSTFRLVCSGIQNQPEYPISDEEIQLAAWMITEGWISKSKKWNDARYQLGQSEKRYPEKVKIIDSLVEKLRLSYNRYIRKDGLVIWQFRKENKPFFDSLLIEGVHTIPRRWLAFFSQRQLQLLLDTLMLGDGTISRNTYHTKDKKHAEDIQELAFRVGKQASIKFQENKKAGIYNVYIRDKHIFGTLNKISKVEKYKGRTWCVTVDSGFIVIRRNEKISITGNCDSLMLAVFGTYFEILPEIEVTQNDIFTPPRNNAEQLFGRNYSRVQKTSRW